ncbi:MAG: FHA domain-containing protein [Coriobacteriales bacterium]
MVDLILLVGRLLLVALLYLFLFFAVKTGVGLVKGQNKKQKSWSVTVEKGPRTLKGVRLTVQGPVVVGRAPGADIVIPTSYVSARHARFSVSGDSLLVEDLGSTNGTLLNGRPIHSQTACSPGDVIKVGNVDIKVGRS